MSEVVDGLDLQSAGTRGRKPQYPWERWFDGRTHRLVRGVDYSIPLKNFRSSVYSAAERANLKIVTRVLDGDLHVQAIGQIEADEGHTAGTSHGVTDGEEDPT